MTSVADYTNLIKDNKEDREKLKGIYQNILKEDFEVSHKSNKLKESAIYGLALQFAEDKNSQALSELNESIRPLFENFPKAKTAKIVRTLIERMEQIPGTEDLQIQMCTESIEWAKKEKRAFLRQRIQVKLAALLFQKNDYTQALEILTQLLIEVRRLDDKSLMVECRLLECKILHTIKNYGRAKSSLIAGRTAANAIYVSPPLQASLDVQSGVLHCEEKDFKTAFSYFYEAWEVFHNLGNKGEASRCLKYMCLAKIMLRELDDINNLLNNKNALEYQGLALEAMRSIATAYQKRDLHTFESTLKKYHTQLVEDRIIESHINDVYEQLMEQHLLRIIEPFSRVQISHIANLIKLKRSVVERKLSQMILDGVLKGILDQQNDCLELVQETESSNLYALAQTSLKHLDKSIDSLFSLAGSSLIDRKKKEAQEKKEDKKEEEKKKAEKK